MHFCNDIRTQKNWQEDQFWIFTIKLTLCVSPTASYGAYPICKGCPVCSRDNGCVNCQPKLFLFLRRERMRQYGECLHDCPAGYYGIRSPELNICSSKSSPAFPNILPRHASFVSQDGFSWCTCSVFSEVSISRYISKVSWKHLSHLDVIGHDIWGHMTSPLPVKMPRYVWTKEHFYK